MEKLAYRIQKEMVTAADYIAWAHRGLQVGNESEALFKLVALTEDANLFEVESYVQQAMRELQFELPTLTSYETIKLLAQDILNTTDDEEMKRLARELFHIASNLGYPDHLSEWVEISEMQDRLQYAEMREPYSQQDVLEKIKEAARIATMKYTCPCCGYKTLDEEPPGTYEICAICFWEDDPIQFDDPDYEGGANRPSLKTAQKNYQLFRACEKRIVEYVRKPNANDEKDPNWKPFL